MTLEIVPQLLFQNSEMIFEKSKKISLDGRISHLFFYLHYCESKLKVVIFIHTLACSSEATLQIAPFDIFYLSRKYFNFRFSSLLLFETPTF